MIICVPDVQNLVKTLGEHILDLLKEAIASLKHQTRSVLVLITSPDRDFRNNEIKMLSRAGDAPMEGSIVVVPSNSGRERARFFKQQTSKKRCKMSNIRRLQYALRTTLEHTTDVPLLQPYASWNFLKDAEVPKILTEDEMTAKDIEQLMNSIGRRYDEEHIRSTLLAFGRRDASFVAWHLAVQDASHESTRDDWSAFPQHVKDAVDELKLDDERYQYELTLLDSLVNPRDIKQGWADIEIETGIKETITQLVNQFFLEQDSLYGIMEQGRVAGALLYGPPGTGKTQLARIVARECQATMLCISFADIVSKWCGDTEKYVRALFKLAKMVSPSIIFIDEADAILHSRALDTQEHGTSMKSQLLVEMDGLSKSPKAPFTLLATNFPRNLDNAVLRRVPSLLHLGLPKRHARMKIFDILLREEILDKDVNLENLAVRTKGFSGSDIKTLCVQAALSCDTHTTQGKNGARKRLMRGEHFTKALARCAPTVSRAALEEVNAFAKDYDYRSFQILLESEPIPKQTFPKDIVTEVTMVDIGD